MSEVEVDRSCPTLDTVKVVLGYAFDDTKYKEVVKTNDGKFFMHECDNMANRFLKEYKRTPNLQMLIEAIVYVARAGTYSLYKHPSMVDNREDYHTNIDGTMHHIKDPKVAILKAIEYKFEKNTFKGTWKDLDLITLENMLSGEIDEYIATWHDHTLDLSEVADIVLYMCYLLDVHRS